MVKLNLGGGRDWEEKGWRNLDKSHGYDLNVELLKEFKSNSVSLIFFSHCLEHLEWENVPLILADCYRVLEPSGVMRVVVPDVDIFYNLLKFNNKKFLVRHNPHFYSRDKNLNRPLIEDVKEMMGYFGEHRSFFTYSILYIMLKVAGFDTIWKLDFLHSKVDELQKEAILNEKGMPISGFDNKMTAAISLYVECMKK